MPIQTKKKKKKVLHSNLLNSQNSSDPLLTQDTTQNKETIDRNQHKKKNKKTKTSRVKITKSKATKEDSKPLHQSTLQVQDKQVKVIKPKNKTNIHNNDLQTDTSLSKKLNHKLSENNSNNFNGIDSKNEDKRNGQNQKKISFSFKSTQMNQQRSIDEIENQDFSISPSQLNINQMYCPEIPKFDMISAKSIAKRIPHKKAISSQWHNMQYIDLNMIYTQYCIPKKQQDGPLALFEALENEKHFIEIKIKKTEPLFLNLTQNNNISNSSIFTNIGKFDIFHFYEIEMPNLMNQKDNSEQHLDYTEIKEMKSQVNFDLLNIDHELLRILGLANHSNEGQHSRYRSNSTKRRATSRLSYNNSLNGTSRKRRRISDNRNTMINPRTYARHQIRSNKPSEPHKYKFKSNQYLKSNELFALKELF